MSQTINDRAAIDFAKGFYDALGAGKSYEFAYKFGCHAIALQGISELEALRPTILALLVRLISYERELLTFGSKVQE